MKCRRRIAQRFVSVNRNRWEFKPFICSLSVLLRSLKISGTAQINKFSGLDSNPVLESDISPLTALEYYILELLQAVRDYKLLANYIEMHLISANECGVQTALIAT